MRSENKRVPTALRGGNYLVADRKPLAKERISDHASFRGFILDPPDVELQATSAKMCEFTSGSDLRTRDERTIVETTKRRLREYGVALAAAVLPTFSCDISAEVID